MEIGDIVKIEIANGLFFKGVYSDDFPGGNSIVIDSGKSSLVAPKGECVLVNASSDKNYVKN